MGILIHLFKDSYTDPRQAHQGEHQPARRHRGRDRRVLPGESQLEAGSRCAAKQKTNQVPVK